MSELIFLIENAAEGGFSAKALGQSIYTDAETEEELRNNIRDAVLCYFEDEEVPKIIRLHFVKDEILELP